GRLLAGLWVVAGTGRALALIGHAVALVNFDDGLDLGVVVAPVGPHGGGAGVAGADAAQFLQIAVEHLGVVGVDAGHLPVTVRLGQPRQRADAALGEDAVAVAVRIGH